MSNYNDVILDYPAAARSIALNLSEFCDKKMAYPNMIAQAADKAAAEIEWLRAQLSHAQNTIHNKVYMQSPGADK